MSVLGWAALGLAVSLLAAGVIARALDWAGEGEPDDDDVTGGPV